MLSHPLYCVPHVRLPGAALGMCVPAPPENTYQSACATPDALDIGWPSCASHSNGAYSPPSPYTLSTLRHASDSVSASASDCGQPAWQ